MCCLSIGLLFFGPRIGFLIYWLTPMGRAQMAPAFNTLIVPILGLIFLPWTTLLYGLAYGQNGIAGFDWVWVIGALIADIATYVSAAAKRREVPLYPENAP